VARIEGAAVSVKNIVVEIEEKKPRPFFKAAGGKTRLLPQILPRLPRSIGNGYYEPFVGGGAVYFALCAEGRFSGSSRVYLADMNPELIHAYKIVRHDVDGLIAQLREGRDYRNDPIAYYRVRALEPESLSTVERAARFLYLNKTCFNGLHRVNRAGRFNVPFGKYDHPTICDEPTLRAASAALRIANFDQIDFEESMSAAMFGDVVYLDPPYLPLSTTSSFTGYTSDGFTLHDHERLRDAMLAAHRRGAHVLLSNCSAPAIRDLYSGPRFWIAEVDAPRSVNSNGKKRGDVKELLIRCSEVT
jgi:DNA adenine methylase